MEKEKNKNFTKLTQKKGISLIVLIVTIIVIIILAAVVILTIGKNNPIDSAKEATFKEDVRSFQDDLSLTISKEYTDKQGQRDEKITTNDYNEIKEKIPSFTEKYKDKFVIENDQLVGTDKLTDKEKEWANDLNVATSGKLPFNAEEWDKTATAETCFQWGSDTEGEEGYNTIIGYNSDLQNYPKVRIPSRCHIIKTSSQVSLDEDVGRSFLKNIQEIEIPNTVIEIGRYAFGSVRGNALNLVTDIVIPNSVTSIEDSAFEGCSSLTNITIPNSVTSIASSAFEGCSSLINITIPNSVTSIASSAFNGCSSLTEIKVDENNKNYSSDNGKLFNKDKTAFIRFPEGEKIDSYIILNRVTSIGYSAFDGCSSLINITIPDSVTSIGSRAFYRCSNLTNINYTGTMAEWNNISKDSNWKDNSAITTITCTDGTITL